MQLIQLLLDMGSATGIRLVNLPGGLNQATNVASKTITITGIPGGTGFVRVETEGTTCEIIRLQHQIRVTTAPQRPDYILIDDFPGGTDPIPIVTDQDGSVYNAKYLCEQASLVHQVLQLFVTMMVELPHQQSLIFGILTTKCGQ